MTLAVNNIPSTTASVDVTSQGSFMTSANRTDKPVSQTHPGVSNATLADLTTRNIFTTAITLQYDHEIPTVTSSTINRQTSKATVTQLPTVTTATTAVCRAPYAEIGLNPMSGTLRHVERNHLSGQWCGWNVRRESLTDHVILLKLTSLSLAESGWPCSGELRLTGYAPFCRRIVPTCFIYSSPQSCEHLLASDLVKSENCTNLYWQSQKRKVWRIVYRSKEAKATKSFSFDYKFISCKQELRGNASEVEEYRNNPLIIAATFSGGVASTIALVAVVCAFKRCRQKGISDTKAKQQAASARGRDEETIQNYEMVNDLRIELSQTSTSAANNIDYIRPYEYDASTFVLHEGPVYDSPEDFNAQSTILKDNKNGYENWGNGTANLYASPLNLNHPSPN